MDSSYLDLSGIDWLHRTRTWISRVLIAFGLLAVIVTAIPIDAWWAHAYSGPLELPRGDVLILLSAANDDEGFISYSSYWRARYAVIAWNTGTFKTIVVSGGGGPAIRDLLIQQGVPESAILAEWASTSTRENGINTARLLQSLPGKKVLLTSDFHMFRAVHVFRKLGVQVTPAPAPDVIKLAKNPYMRIPAFETMVVETVKIIGYRARGWI